MYFKEASEFLTKLGFDLITRKVIYKSPLGRFMAFCHTLSTFSKTIMITF